MSSIVNIQTLEVTGTPAQFRETIKEIGKLGSGSSVVNIGPARLRALSKPISDADLKRLYAPRVTRRRTARKKAKRKIKRRKG